MRIVILLITFTIFLNLTSKLNKVLILIKNITRFEIVDNIFPRIEENSKEFRKILIV